MPQAREHDPERDRASPHAPVLLREVAEALAPIPGGTFLDGTFGAGGYSRALLAAGAARVIGLDRDPTALAAARAAPWAAEAGPRLSLLETRFSALDAAARHVLGGGAAGGGLDGVALDIGVSSMQLDRAERGFSFLRDGPLDMRMSGAGVSAADVVAEASEARLADIFYRFGEERGSRRLARAVAAARAEAPIETTGRLAEIIAHAAPRPKPGQPHPATRAFQALRIYVNGELDELAAALGAAERALAPGGRLAVVTFHSLEDRIVKRFLQEASGRVPGASRHAPGAGGTPEINPALARAQGEGASPRFELIARRPITPSEAELAANPRARSAKLRWARRTAAPAGPAPDGAALGAPEIDAADDGPARGARRRRRRL